MVVIVMVFFRFVSLWLRQISNLFAMSRIGEVRVVIFV